MRPDRPTAFFLIFLPFLALRSFLSGFNSHLRQLSIVRCPSYPGLTGLALCRLSSCWLIFFMFELSDLLSSSGCPFGTFYVPSFKVCGCLEAVSRSWCRRSRPFCHPISEVLSGQWSAMDAETSLRLCLLHLLVNAMMKLIYMLVRCMPDKSYTPIKATRL